MADVIYPRLSTVVNINVLPEEPALRCWGLLWSITKEIQIEADAMVAAPFTPPDVTIASKLSLTLSSSANNNLNRWCEISSRSKLVFKISKKKILTFHASKVLEAELDPPLLMSKPFISCQLSILKGNFSFLRFFC